jgi:hypothetical protein
MAMEWAGYRLCPFPNLWVTPEVIVLTLDTRSPLLPIFVRPQSLGTSVPLAPPYRPIRRYRQGQQRVQECIALPVE